MLPLELRRRSEHPLPRRRAPPRGRREEVKDLSGYPVFNVVKSRTYVHNLYLSVVTFAIHHERSMKIQESLYTSIIHTRKDTLVRQENFPQSLEHKLLFVVISRREGDTISCH